MPYPYRPHALVPGGTALTDTSIDDLIRPGLRMAFPLPSEDDPMEAKFRRLLDALAQRSRQSGGRGSFSLLRPRAPTLTGA